MDGSQPCRVLNALRIEVRAEPSDVVGDRPGKKSIVLKNTTNLRSITL